MDYKRLRPSQVRLDPQNPRLPDGTSSDHEAVNRLLDENYSALLALARDLVETGESNPSELPIVIKDGSKYLVLEGNRRFAALKLLATPSLADDEKQRAAFARLAKKGTAPKTVMCAVDVSRETADHWLLLRHTGENNGVGVRRWNAQQTATHRKRANATVDSGTARSITIADELEEAYSRDAALISAVRSIRASKLTNLGRFFSAEVMTRLHLSIKDTEEMYARERTLWAKRSAADLHAFFGWAVEYIDKHSVDAYKNAAIRSTLLDTNSDLLPDTSDIANREESRLADSPWRPPGDVDPDDTDDEADEEPDAKDDAADDEGLHGGGGTGGGDTGGNDDGDTSGGTNGGGEQGSPGDDSSGPGKRKNEAKEEKRLLQDLKLPNLLPRTQFLLREARQVEHDAAPGIACVMARVLVELVVSDPDVLAWSGAQEKGFFKDKVVACLKVLDPKFDKGRPGIPALNPAYLETVNEGFGTRLMHQFVHNPSARPDPHMSRRFSTHFRALLIAVDHHTGLQGP